MNQEILKIVVECVQEAIEEQDIDVPQVVNADLIIFGKGGVFDSIGLVSLVVAIEETIQDRLAQSISLADQKALSETRSPYRSVGSLVEYASTLVDRDD